MCPWDGNCTRSRDLPGNIGVGNVQGTSQLAARFRVKGRLATG